MVDVRTQTVLRHAKPREIDETGKAVLDEGRWDSAQDRVQDRKEQGGDRFDSALAKEHSRERDLDDLFQKAQEKIAKRKKALGDEGEIDPQ